MNINRKMTNFLGSRCKLIHFFRSLFSFTLGPCKKNEKRGKGGPRTLFSFTFLKKSERTPCPTSLAVFVMNWGTACGVFEAFSHFQIIGKNPKINKYFFDEKNQKCFWSMKKIGPKLFQKTTKITGFLN